MRWSRGRPTFLPWYDNLYQEKDIRYRDLDKIYGKWKGKEVRI